MDQPDTVNKKIFKKIIVTTFFILIKILYILEFQGLIYEIKNSKTFYFMDRPGAVNEKTFVAAKFFICLKVFLYFMDGPTTLKYNIFDSRC